MQRSGALVTRTIRRLYRIGGVLEKIITENIIILIEMVLALLIAVVRQLHLKAWDVTG